MNIALCHFRAGEPDGVSLEMEKWKLALEKQEHHVHILAGSLGVLSEGYIIPELQYIHPINLKIAKNAYAPLCDFNNETTFRETIFELAEIIKLKLVKFITKNKIDVLAPNNFWSIGGGFPAAIAIHDAVKETGIKCIPHHHDFYWESCRSTFRSCDTIIELLDKYFPPTDIPQNQIKHVVINKISHRELKQYKNLDSTVVPNVFDFEAPLWKIDDYNSDFRAAIGLKKNDILVLQATRIVTRKAIEMAIEFVGELCTEPNLKTLYKHKLYNGQTFDKNSRIVYVLAGKQEADEKYLNLLKQKAKSCNVEISFIGDIVEHSRIVKNGKKCYSLWDTYVHADIVTYTSIQEGWGNQFLETMFAKLPILIYEYPVFETDIKPRGFDIISLGNSHKTDKDNLVYVQTEKTKKAAQHAVEMLIDSNKRKKTVEYNFNTCKKHFSYNTLNKILKELFRFE